jgi:RNA polymerase sigma factor (sigma-70 family)
MNAERSIGAAQLPGGDSEVAALIPLVRRIISSRVSSRATAEDLVQETLVRVLAAVDRIESGMLEAYAIVTARNLVTSMRRQEDRHRRHEHRIVDARSVAAPDELLLRREEQQAVADALCRLSDRDRQTLLAHEVSGQDTQSLGEQLGLTAGAVAAQLKRSRARLRVEYLLTLERRPRCRSVPIGVRRRSWVTRGRKRYWWLCS